MNSAISNSPFPSFYEEFIYKSRYSRWVDSENRRENWDETVTRYMKFMINSDLPGYDVDIYNELWDAIYNLNVMPSMRLLMTAGIAAERDNTCAYNCSYLPIDDQKTFDEVMYILFCGIGVGFSVE